MIISIGNILLNPVLLSASSCPLYLKQPDAPFGILFVNISKLSHDETASLDVFLQCMALPKQDGRLFSF